MKVWLASFRLVPKWPKFVLCAGIFAALIGRADDRSGAPKVGDLVAFIPNYLEIANPLFRLAIPLLALWIVLEIVLTLTNRLRIRRDNEVGLKR